VAEGSTPQRSFEDLCQLTRLVADAFDQRERRPWTIEALLIELTKQVGDLVRHVMMAEGYYLPDRDADPRYATTQANIADELADILDGIMRLADYYKIDLEAAHVAARQRELGYLRRASVKDDD
jgi:NTP pyrophosphatase (non-canonical NTP hydrolase)